MYIIYIYIYILSVEKRQIEIATNVRTPTCPRKLLRRPARGGASEIDGRLARCRRGGEPGGEVAVAHVFLLGALPVALVEVESVA